MSFKSPQFTQRTNRGLWYVQHPEPTRSHFLQGLASNTLEQSRRMVAERCKAFRSAGDKNAIIDLDPALYEVSQSLFARRVSTVERLGREGVGDARPLGLDVELLLWDELFNQLIARDNAPLRQTCLQMLITSHVIRVLQTPDLRSLASRVILTPRLPEAPSIEARLEGFLHRLAQVKVLIPSCFSRVRDKGTSGGNGRRPSARAKPPRIRGVTRDGLPATRALDALQRDHRVGVGRDRLARLEQLQDDLTRAYRGGSLAREDAPRRPEDGPGADETATLPARLRRFLERSDLQGANQRKIRLALRAQMTAETLRAPKLGRASDDEAIPTYAYVVTHERAPDGETELWMTLRVGYDDAFVTEARYTLTVARGFKVVSTQVREVATSPRRQVTLQLFPEQGLPLKAEDQYRLEGSFKLDRGQTITFSTQGALSKDRATGLALEVPSDDSAGTTDPADTAPDTTAEPEPTQPAPTVLYGVNRLGIAVFHKVEQEVCCYVPGEVSHIENVLAREYKERTTRILNRSETTTEDVVSVEVEQQRDTSTAERNELASEIANVLNSQRALGFNTNTEVSGSYAAMEFSGGAAFDYGMSNGSTSSNADARSRAEEVTRSALDRVVQSQTSKRTARMLKEYEENNRHGFDNRKGDKHVTGVYRWVDILYQNRLVNYGKHLMVEFLVPEPAAFYLEAMQAKKPEQDAATEVPETGPVPPISLGEAGVTDPTQITRSTYMSFARQFDAQLEAPFPEDGDPVSLDLRPSDAMGSPKGPEGKRNQSYQFKIMLPTGYQLSHADFRVNFEYHYGGTETGTFMRATLAGKKIMRDGDDLPTANRGWETLDFDRTYDGTFTEQITLQLDMTNVHDFNVSGRLETIWSDYEQNAWQERCYAALQAAYDRQYDQYERDLADWNAKQSAAAATPAGEEAKPDFGVSSDANRTIERQELKRNAIEMLMRPYGRVLGQDFLELGGCDVLSVRQDADWESYSSQVKFFEQSFEWNSMAYVFYPYYWADRCDWARLLQVESSSDPLFTSFLRSGMARVVVPVRRGFEDAISYYLDTGDIWLGGDLVLQTDDELYLSVAEELREVEGVVAEEWQTRVPTTLTIVQGESVYLDNRGLPCCDSIHSDGSETGLQGSTNLLEGLPRVS